MTTDHAATIASAVGKLNTGDVAGYVSSLCAADCAFHGFPAAFAPTRDGIADFFRALIAAVPDARIAPLDLVADGDDVAVRYALTGTHTGELFGFDGTGRSLAVEGLTMLHFVDGVVVERWNRLDDAALLAQLGELPVTVPA